jgi:hypothetical protein
LGKDSGFIEKSVFLQVKQKQTRKRTARMGETDN